MDVTGEVEVLADWGRGTLTTVYEGVRYRLLLQSSTGEWLAHRQLVRLPGSNGAWTVPTRAPHRAMRSFPQPVRSAFLARVRARAEMLKAAETSPLLKKGRRAGR